MLKVRAAMRCLNRKRQTAFADLVMESESGSATAVVTLTSNPQTEHRC